MEAQAPTPRAEARPLNILLADDGSQHSAAAIALLRDLPLPRGSQVKVLGVLIPRESSNHHVLEAGLKQTRCLLEEKGLQAAAQLKLGYPAEQILEQAEKDRPDLIVLGAKGLRATLGIMLGGVAQQVVEYAGTPVLVVRPPYHPLEHVLLVVDGSLHAQAAVAFLAAFPLPPGVQVTVLHVLPPLISSFLLEQSRWGGPEVLPSLVLPDYEDETAQLAEEERQGERLLAAAARPLAAAGLEVKTVLARGDAATEILDYAAQHNAGWIVSGSRGLSPLQSWLGSVSRKLVHYARCSVLVVKGPHDWERP